MPPKVGKNALKGGRLAPAGNTHPNYVENVTVKPAPNLVSDADSEVGHREIGSAYCFARMGAP